MSVEKKLSLRGKAEWAGARKVLAALKRAHKIKGPVKLAGAPAPAPKRRRRANPRRARNIAGFMSGGVFHPIRSGERMITYRGKKVLVKDERAYSRKKAGEKARRAKKNPSNLYSLQHRKGGRWLNSYSPVTKALAREILKAQRAQDARFNPRDWRIISIHSTRASKNPKKLTKKQEFLRRMRLGRLRAARARNKSRR